jgi:hypothetical protein
MNEFFLDQRPDDPGHLVPVHLDDGIGDFDFLHGTSYRMKRRREA